MAGAATLSERGIPGRARHSFLRRLRDGDEIAHLATLLFVTFTAFTLDSQQPEGSLLEYKSRFYGTTVGGGGDLSGEV